MGEISGSSRKFSGFSAITRSVNRSHTPSPRPDFGTGLRARLEQLRRESSAEVRHLPVRRMAPQLPVVDLRRVAAA
jgi:hypothetical protein